MLRFPRFDLAKHRYSRKADFSFVSEFCTFYQTLCFAGSEVSRMSDSSIRKQEGSHADPPRSPGGALRAPGDSLDSHLTVDPNASFSRGFFSGRPKSWFWGRAPGGAFSGRAHTGRGDPAAFFFLFLLFPLRVGAAFPFGSDSGFHFRFSCLYVGIRSRTTRGADLFNLSLIHI